MSRARQLFRSVCPRPSNCVLVALCGVLLAFCPLSSTNRGRNVTISRGTTYLTEPLGPDGRVDFARRSTRC